MIENQEVRVKESFIDFIDTKNKTGEVISDMIVSKLKADGLDVMNCRGQAYDNAATMAGCHTGVQQRIKDINPNAEFVSCSNYSLNLVCIHAPSVEDNLVALHFKYDFWYRTATAGSDVVQSGRPIFDDFFQHLWPYIGNNTSNVVFQMVKRLWLIRIYQ
ncbi:hypothetical protein TNCV_192431 [Trichonephila clavipes]|nr:hypothetical protein TNCV_192431 [Trichonephila clavipes]